MPDNAPHNALRSSIDRAIAAGEPVFTNVRAFSNEEDAFKAAGDAATKQGKPIMGFRVLSAGHGLFKVLMVPVRETPFYLS